MELGELAGMTPEIIQKVTGPSRCAAGASRCTAAAPGGGSSPARPPGTASLFFCSSKTRPRC